MRSIVFSLGISEEHSRQRNSSRYRKNANYLEEHDMEWHGDYVRQKGPKSLGLIKFLFPNSNAIYYTTLLQRVYSIEDRAFSHGCIRVEVELATQILKMIQNGMSEKLESGEEKWYTLQNKIPVYIGYFTAWVDDKDEIHFMKIYKRDDELASLLSNNDSKCYW
jgi:murein L,D-transpeptidase YcbB/YkuD